MSKSPTSAIHSILNSLVINDFIPASIKLQLQRIMRGGQIKCGYRLNILSQKDGDEKEILMEQTCDANQDEERDRPSCY